MPLASDASQKTEINWGKYDSRAVVFSDEPAIARRLLRHPLFEADQVLESDDEVIAVEGTFPVRAVKLCLYQRESTGHAHVLAFDGEQKRDYVEEHMRESDG
jgi:hypothetical protein